jgi:hypothetical protein
VLLLRLEGLKSGPHDNGTRGLRTHAGEDARSGLCASVGVQPEERVSARHKSKKTETHQKCSPRRFLWREERLSAWGWLVSVFFSSGPLHRRRSWPQEGHSRPNEGQVAATAGSHPPFPAVCCHIWTARGMGDLTSRSATRQLLTVKPFTGRVSPAVAPPLSPPVDASETRSRRRRTQNTPFGFCGSLFVGLFWVPVAQGGLGCLGWGGRRGGRTLSLSHKGGKEICARKNENAIHLEAGFFKLVAALMCFPPTSPQDSVEKPNRSNATSHI